MAIDDGGPAFPTVLEQRLGGFEGMSRRDYFAAKAMQAALSLCQSGGAHEPHSPGEWDIGTVARTAYSMADAMIAVSKDTRAPIER